MKPRLYSVANLAGNQFSLLASKSLLPNKNIGLCSGFKRTLKGGDQVQYEVRSGGRFRLDKDDTESDLILIAMGSGLAPFLSFL